MDTLPSAFNEAVFAHRKSVVSVIGDGTGNGSFLGSAYGQSLIMTAEHVVRGKEEVTICIPSVGSNPGRVILEDNVADVALIMISNDSVISREAQVLNFSNVAVAVDRDVVMLAHFYEGLDVMIQPGTSHGYSIEKPPSTVTPTIQYLYASFSGKRGNSGAPLFIVENGAAVAVGMVTHQIYQEIYQDDKAAGVRILFGHQSIMVDSILSCLRNKLGPAAGGMSIQEMVPVIIDAVLRGGPGGAHG